MPVSEQGHDQSNGQRDNARIVIAGGGVIGLSVAFHLARAGASQVTLLERNRLTSGTSWHAAGIVGPLRSSQNLTTLARYGITLFAQLEKETGQPTGYQRTGGYWLAQHPQRLQELQRIGAMAELNELSASIIGKEDLKARLPQLQTDDLCGALWVEEDGQINPVDLCNAYAKGARDAGATLREHAAVTDLSIKHNAPKSVTVNNDELIDCDIFINCAGLWAGEVGKLASVNIPVQAVEHYYLVTEPIDDLQQPFPILRDLDSDIYIKGDAGKLVIGAFEPNAKLWHPDSVPPDADFLMFNEDWDHAAPTLQAAMHRMPVVENTGIRQFLCGPESFTPDTRQLMGTASELNNYYVAAGFNSIGIMSSAGVGKAMADWVLSETAPMDLWEVDLQRFDASDSEPEFLSARTAESVNNQFAMHWPGKQYKTARDRKHSVWHKQLAAEGAVFGAPTGWERPLWYEPQRHDQQRDNHRGTTNQGAGHTTDKATGKATHYSYGDQYWWPYAEREAQTLVEQGALFELSPFSKIEICGNEALAFLQTTCSRNMDIANGQIVYTLMLNDNAGIEVECTINRLSELTFLLVGGAATRLRDITFLRRSSHGFSDVTITDRTDEYACVGVMGTQAQSVLHEMFKQAGSPDELRFSTSRYFAYSNVDCSDSQIRVARISYVGEFGYELYVPTAIAQSFMQQLLTVAKDLQMIPAGHYCLDACRLEKNFPHWGHDIGPELNPLQADLQFAVDRNKQTVFRGQQALLDQFGQPLTKKRVLFSVDSNSDDNNRKPLLLHDEPIYRNGKLIGATTSGGLGFRTGTALSMAVVGVDSRVGKGHKKNHDQTDLQHWLNDDAEFQIRLGDKLVPATLLKQIPYDADRNRLLPDRLSTNV